MRDFRRFVKGVILKPNDGGSNPIGNLSGVLTAADNGAIYHYQNRIKAFLDAAEREIITNDQSQTLTNKTIDADNNTISNIENDNIKAGAAIAESKLDLDYSTSGLNTAISNHVSATSAHGVTGSVVGTSDSQSLTNKTIDVDNNTISNIELDNFKAGVIDLDDTLAAASDLKIPTSLTVKNYVDAAVATKDQASEISYSNTSSGLAAVNVQAAIDEVESRLDTAESGLSGHTGASTNVHGIGVGNSVVGTGTTQELTNKTLTAAIIQGLTVVENYISEESEDSSISGASAVITSPTKPIVRLTNASLISVAGISALESATFGGVLTVVNATANDIDILNNAGVASEAILTGTDDDITLAPDAAILLKYDVVSNKFRIIGGTGSGSVVIKAVAGENLAAREAVYLSVGAADSRTAGQAYKLDASNDNRIEYVGLVKATVTSGQTVKIITGGVVKGFTGLSVGVPVWMNPLVPGSYSQTDPLDNSYDNRFIIKLGTAISSTQVLINSDQAASAYFKPTISSTFSVANNQSSAANVTSLVFDGSAIRSFIIDYTIYRSTDSNELAQIGRLRGIYKTVANQWLMSDDYSGENAGINFTITTTGQIQYTSTNVAGTSYVGTLDYDIVKAFEV